MKLVTLARTTILGLAAYSVIPTAAFGQSTAASYKTVMDKPYDNVPGKVGADLGEQYNMYTGILQFRQVDLELNGTPDLPIVIARKLETGKPVPFLMYRPLNQFGDWRLETPRIWATLPRPADPTGSNVYGATNEVAGWRTNSCSQGLPGNYDIPNTFTENPDSYGSGHFLSIPGQSDELILTRDVYHSGIFIADAPGNAPLLTKSNWRIQCGNSLRNLAGQVIGESFVATSPQGVTYYFDLLTGEDDHAEPVPLPQGVPGLPVPITRYSIVATRAVDPFGNSINYNYDSTGRLSSITASDGRAVSLEYSGPTPKLISRIFSGTRSWSYSYGDLTGNLGTKVLRTVTRPDGSKWSFNLDDIARPYYYDGRGPTTQSDCSTAVALRSAVIAPDLFTGSLTSPTGLSASYQIGLVFNGVINTLPPPNVNSPACFETIALRRKTYSGPGISAESWTYTYNNPSADSGAQFKTLSITNPDNSKIAADIDIHSAYTEGSILREYFISASGETLRSSSNTYAPGHFFGLSPSGGLQNPYIQTGQTELVQL